jgi:hypothetical protein
MCGTSAQEEWISRVLGVAVGDTGGAIGGGDAEALRAARDAYQSALTAVDRQISALAKALLASGDDDMEEIAAYELGQMIAANRAALLDLLRSASSGDTDRLRAAAPKIRDAASVFRAQLDTDPRIAACDANPFSVPVSIRSTLARGLAGLDAVAKRASTR